MSPALGYCNNSPITPLNRKIAKTISKKDRLYEATRKTYKIEIL
jgi:hypothetical protein